MRKGQHISEETRQKMRAAQRGKKMSPESIEKGRQSRQGYCVSDETKLKISISSKGHLVSEETRIKISLRKTGSHYSEEAKKKMSDARMGKAPWNKGTVGIMVAWNKGLSGFGAGKKHPWMAKGENHYNWQGGKSYESYGMEFNTPLKELVRTRDGRICWICGISELDSGEKLHCHHIDYNKQNNMPDNLISLCRSCHLKTNYSRNDWISYFKKEL